MVTLVTSGMLTSKSVRPSCTNWIDSSVSHCSSPQLKPSTFMVSGSSSVLKCAMKCAFSFSKSASWKPSNSSCRSLPTSFSCMRLKLLPKEAFLIWLPSIVMTSLDFWPFQPILSLLTLKRPTSSEPQLRTSLNCRLSSMAPVTHHTGRCARALEPPRTLR